MTSFRSHDNSNAAFKFVFTGLVALSLLFVIGVVFTLWYIIRKRKDEKSRHSRHIEETFPERLASRSTAGKGSSKIDLGFTSQQTLNKDQEDGGGERRPTFSRFLNLWKGLRNSKRKPANEEPRRSVVFTIPTEDVFPKTHARQQTYYCAEDKPLNQTDGVKTSHICEVHQVPHDVIEEISNHSSSDEDTDMENELTEKASHMEIDTEFEGNTNNGSASLRSDPTLDEGRVDTLETLDRRNSDGRQLQGKEGKSFSKESDVDSGCGSSCHEIYASDAQITHAQLNITTLAYCHAQKIEEYKMRETEEKFTEVSVAPPEVKETSIEYIGNTIQDNLSKKISVASLDGRDIESNAGFGLCEQPNLDSSSNEDCSHEFQKQKVTADSFEELIKLAKDGMSTLARKRVDNTGKKNRNTIPDRFLDTILVDKLTDTQDNAMNTDKGLESQEEDKLSTSLKDSATDSKLCLDTREVDSGVKCISSTSLCLNEQSNMGKTLCCIEIQPSKSAESIRDLPSNSASSIGSLRSDYVSASSCVIEIPTIVLESEQDTGENTAETTAVQITCLREQDSYQEVNIDQCRQNDETTGGINEDALQQKAVTIDKQNDLPVRRIEQTFLNHGITEKATRPQSLILPATSTAAADQNKYGSKVPSLETLNLPSQDNNGRIRSFSATIRRKLSFRERISSDDMDIERQVDPGMPKSKKIKGFRSFRVNKKKKSKASKTEDISQSTGCLDGSNSKKYWSTFDKLFHENTGSVSFSDVPFTIPEISEQ